MSNKAFKLFRLTLELTGRERAAFYQTRESDDERNAIERSG
jgi:hypothetical protein